MQVDEALVDAHLERVPGLGACVRRSRSQLSTCIHTYTEWVKTQRRIHMGDNGICDAASNQHKKTHDSTQVRGLQCRNHGARDAIAGRPETCTPPSHSSILAWRKTTPSSTHAHAHSDEKWHQCPTRVPSPHGVLRQVMVKNLVGMRTGPLGTRPLPLAPVIKSAHTAPPKWSVTRRNTNTTQSSRAGKPTLRH